MRTWCSIVLAFILLAAGGCKTGGSDNGGGNGNNNKEYEAPQGQGNTYWWNDTVFYEVFVRSFYDSDGDGIGDLKGLTAKLDYLNDGNPQTSSDLGITGIWLMPVCESPSYHGYDTADYRTIEQDYGTNADFTAFLAAARQRGIKVIVDLVVNHTSGLHPWFTGSAVQDGTHDNWYRWSVNDPGQTGPWGQQVWHRHANGQYYYGLFWGGMPDLNYGEPAVYTEILNICRFWLVNMDVDGFRCDAVKYIYEDGAQLENTAQTFDFWKQLRQDIKAIRLDCMTVGEAWDDTDVVQNYSGGDGLDFCFEFNLATAILAALEAGSPATLKGKMKDLKDAYPYHQYGVFLTNHDQNRVMDELGDDLARAKLAAGVYLTLPGVPFLYYGEEIGMRGIKPDEDIRRPMQWNGTAHAGFTAGIPWRPVDPNFPARNVETMQGDTNSLWHRYRRLLRLREQYQALDRGTYQAVGSSHTSVYAFLRQHEEEIFLVVHNFSAFDLNTVTFDIDTTHIPAGSYSVTGVLHDPAATSVTVDPGGGFTGWTPLSGLDAGETYILRLQR